MDGNDLPKNPWRYPGEEVATGDDNNSSFGCHYSNNDLFELVRQFGGGGGGATGQPAVSRLQSSWSPAMPPPPLPSELMPLNTPPSEDVMAAWLYPIVSGLDHDDDGKTPAMTKEASKAIGSSRTMMTERNVKLLATDGMSGTKDPNAWSESSENKASGGSSSRKGSTQNSGTHNIAEKRRRCKITEKLRTLQQLVPGCDKANQASTLDRTIQYMKSLQTHVQAMSMRPASPSSVAAAGYPFLHTPAAAAAMPMPSAAVDPGTTAAAGGHVIPHAGMIPMVQLGAMLPYSHMYYQAAMMPATTAAVMAPPFYGPAPAVSTDDLGAGSNLPQCSVTMEQQQQHKKEKGTRRS